ncbi:MAG: transporter associated domain-containing protein [Pseudomonadota bacterium]
MDDLPSRPSFFERLSDLLLREPEDRQQLITLLRGAFDRHLLDSDTLSMIEGALQVSEMTARDAMVSRSLMQVIKISDEPTQFIPFIVEARHSRFPVIGEQKDDVLGILLAKDLLQYYASPEAFDVKEVLRPAVFVPESKRLNILLRDFRQNRHHMAIVVDEYGGVSGLITIEDILEAIVGDIQDEHDFEDESNISEDTPRRFRVKAQTSIEELNNRLNTHFPQTDHYDTVGGLILSTLGRLPQRGERITLDSWVFEVLRSDSRRLHSFLIEFSPTG